MDEEGTFTWPSETEFASEFSEHPSTADNTMQTTIANIVQTIKKSTIDFGITTKNFRDETVEEATAARSSMHNLARDFLTTVKTITSNPNLDDRAAAIQNVTETAQETVTEIIETTAEELLTTRFGNSMNQDNTESAEQTLFPQSVTQVALDLINSTLDSTTEPISAKSVVADNTLISVYVITAGVLIVVIIAILIGIACWKRYKKHSVDLMQDYCVTELKEISLSSTGKDSLNSKKTVET